MNKQMEVLWHLRIYGPCSIAALVISTKRDRKQVMAAMVGLRANGLAERTMRATYRITTDGEQKTRNLGMPLFAT